MRQLHFSKASLILICLFFIVNSQVTWKEKTAATDSCPSGYIGADYIKTKPGCVNAYIGQNSVSSFQIKFSGWSEYRFVMVGLIPKRKSDFSNDIYDYVGFHLPDYIRTSDQGFPSWKNESVGGGNWAPELKPVYAQYKFEEVTYIFEKIGSKIQVSMRSPSVAEQIVRTAELIYPNEEYVPYYGIYINPATSSKPFEAFISLCTQVAPEPSGDCGIAYSECNFKGCFYKVCSDTPEIKPIIAKSVYVPPKKILTLYEKNTYGGNGQKFDKTVSCI